MWGTDTTSAFTLEEGQATIFVAVDPCTAEGVGIHAAKRKTRFEAPEAIRQGVRERFGGYEAEIAAGLRPRHDHGSASMSDAFQEETPEGNGCSERFIRMLQEPLLWVQTFRTVEELRRALHARLKTDDEQWRIERHGHRAPARVRRDLLASKVAAWVHSAR